MYCTVGLLLRRCHPLHNSHKSSTQACGSTPSPYDHNTAVVGGAAQRSGWWWWWWQRRRPRHSGGGAATIQRRRCVWGERGASSRPSGLQEMHQRQENKKNYPSITRLGEGGGKREGPPLARVRGEGEGQRQKGDPTRSHLGRGRGWRLGDWVTISVSHLERGRGGVTAKAGR